MLHALTFTRRVMGIAVFAGLAGFGCTSTTATEPTDFTVEGGQSLAMLMALSDSHLGHIANHFQVFSGSEVARSADWAQMRPFLAAIADVTVPGLFWYARADGSYWSVQQGQAAGNLSDRSYWPKLMAGNTVIGDLVASKATGKSSAIVAVPVRNASGAITGVLGASVYLDSLSLLLKREMDLKSDQIFFSVDATPIGALQDDPEQIFLDPYALNEPELERAIRDMLTHDEGVVNYSFRGKQRTVLYRKSTVTGWWYAFGHVWD